METPRIFINVLRTPAHNVQWNNPVTSTTSFFGGALQSSSVQNAEASFDFYADAGTYDLDVLHNQAANRGIYTIYVDGVLVGTVDGYSATGGSVRSTLTGIVLTGGRHRIRLVLATKNASSTSYFGLLSGLVLRNTA